jgi:hypothetical protein
MMLAARVELTQRRRYGRIQEGAIFGANVRERDMSARDISDSHLTLRQRAWQDLLGSWHRS